MDPVSEQEWSNDPHQSRRRLIGIGLILIAVLMVAQGAWLQYQRGRELDCQAAYNNAVAEDRKALNTMIFALVDERSGQRVKEKAIADYVAKAQATSTTAPDCR